MDQDEVQVEIEVTPSPDEQAHLALAAEFNPFPFTQDACNSIISRRSFMSNELVFDLLLDQASIASPQSLFPPDSPENLIHLLDAIAKCSWHTLKKWSLHFYLLSYISPEAAAKHATACALPPEFEHLAHACFLLDSGSLDDLARAVSLLSDARILQDLSSKILSTLSLAPQPVSSRLVRTYVQTAQPVLESYDDLAIYLRALMECSLVDAWTFQRTFSETTPLRNQLFRTILDGCFIPPKPSVLPHLLSLPLTSFEFSLLQSYALSPPENLSPAAYSILQDLIAVRLLHSGKYSDAIRLSRAFDAKSQTGNTPGLRKAAEQRQQMMHDVLAVIPEVQRRQLELELGDERVDVESTSLGASWASMGGSDVSMSWENLGTPGSAKARDKAGRLEGSPAPKIPGRTNTPFGLFSSPAGTPLKRKASGNVTPTNIFGTPASAKTIPAVLPKIPTPGLGVSTTASTPPVLPAYRPLQRFDFVTPQRRHSGTIQNGSASTSATRQGAGLNSRNAFFEPEPERTPGTSLFGSQTRGSGESTSVFATRRTHFTDGSTRRASASRQSGPPGVVADETLDDDYMEQATQEDVMMVDSDDPDSFVVRGRRRTSARPVPPAVNTDGDPDTGSANGVHERGTTLFGRRDTGGGARKMDRGQNVKGSRTTMVVPGGFTAFELEEQDPPAAPPHPPSQSVPEYQRQSKEPSPRPSRTRTRRNESAERGPQPLKIPGGLFENVDDTPADEEQEQDTVPSLPFSLSTKGHRRTRGSRQSGAAELGDDDDARKKSLRRSSRLSSVGTSPEPLSSPQKPEKKTTSKRPSKATTIPDGTGRSTRTRKNTGQ